MINVGLIGFGYWGPNLARNFSQHPECRLVRISDRRLERCKTAAAMYPGVQTTLECDEIIAAKDIDLVAIATPVFTHFELARKAILNGKHVLIEKPMTSSIREAEELNELALSKNKIIMVDHTFLFTGAVKKIKEIVDSGKLGDIYYYDSIRVNLGLFQTDVNVIWDLAPHDFSITDHLFHRKPVAISASGQSHFRGKPEDVAYITVYYENNFIAHFNVNWLSPVKVRHTLIGASKAMLQWDDLLPDAAIKIYDRGVDIAESGEGIYNLLASYRMGEMYAPVIKPSEALKEEISYLVECINKSRAPFNGAEAGGRIVRMLEFANKSLKQQGVPVEY